MSEKIKITVEQDERIKQESQNGDAEYKILTLECHINGWSAPLNQCLNTLSISDMARILCDSNSYEVEQKFKVGDSVAHTKGAFKGVKNVTHLNFRGYVFVDDVCDVGYPPSNVRHSTKEEAFWNSLNRNVKEFRIGDIYVDAEGESFHVEDDEDILTYSEWYDACDFTGLHLATPLNKFPK